LRAKSCVGSFVSGFFGVAPADLAGVVDFEGVAVGAIAGVAATGFAEADAVDFDGVGAEGLAGFAAATDDFEVVRATDFEVGAGDFILETAAALEVPAPAGLVIWTRLAASAAAGLSTDCAVVVGRGLTCPSVPVDCLGFADIFLLCVDVVCGIECEREWGRREYELE